MLTNHRVLYAVSITSFFLFLSACGRLPPEAQSYSSKASALSVSAKVSQLIDDLSSDSASVRSAAAKALGEMGGKASKAIPALIKALSTDDDASVRSNAAVALGEMKGKASPAILALINAFMTDKDATTSNSAKNALAMIGAKANLLLIQALSEAKGTIAAKEQELKETKEVLAAKEKNDS